MHAVPTRRLTRPGYPRAALMAGWRELGRSDFRPVLRQISVPTLVLCGARDYLGVRAARVLFTGIGTASMQTIPQVGHLVTQSPTFPALLTTFLTAIPD
ncbi:alpha/beta fold hydrolase [Fodinicola feengrottensis]|nr:alpha/beta hydrolase [Fodinicola feengrottensis]